MSRATARLAGRAASTLSDLVTGVDPISFTVGQAAAFAQRAIADPKAGLLEAAAFFVSPLTAGLAPLALDLLGTGDTVSAGDLQRLRTRLAACTTQLQQSGRPVALGALRGEDLNTIAAAFEYAKKRTTTPRSVRTIHAADALVRSVGYAGLLDPELRQEGIGGPAFKRLQAAIAAGGE